MHIPSVKLKNYIPYIFMLIALVSSLPSFGQEDLVIQLNDTTFSASMDKDYSLNLKGTPIHLKISSKDTLHYSSSFLSFSYPKLFKVSKTTIGEGIDQVSILTGEGSGIIIQKYETINPSALNELMLREITKESINYGFKSSKSTYQRKLKSGQEIEVTKDILRYKDDVNIYEVASIGKKDAGIIIITMKMDEDIHTEGQKVIDLMWQSLTVE